VCKALVETPGRDELAETLDKVVGQAERAAQIIRRMRRFVRFPQPQREPADVNQAVRETVGLVESEARRKGVQISLDLLARDPRLRVDSIQLQQVILNLLQNGIDALEQNAPADRRLTVRSSEGPDGGVEIAVQDSGPGFGDTPAERVFEPFFTTKHDGMGLGLAISRSIVEAHAGRLWASSSADQGATFHVWLPDEGGR
jgi:C4-dicarboxylate-specific signal transduction histidine kinase